MTGRRALIALVSLTAILLCGFLFLAPARMPQDAAPESGVQACSSCDARHQSLTRLRDAARRADAVTE